MARQLPEEAEQTKGGWQSPQFDFEYSGTTNKSAQPDWVVAEQTGKPVYTGSFTSDPTQTPPPADPMSEHSGARISELPDAVPKTVPKSVPKPQPKKENVFTKIGHAGQAVGGFVSDVAEDVVNTAGNVAGAVARLPGTFASNFIGGAAAAVTPRTYNAPQISPDDVVKNIQPKLAPNPKILPRVTTPKYSTKTNKWSKGSVSTTTLTPTTVGGAIERGIEGVNTALLFTPIKGPVGLAAGGITKAAERAGLQLGGKGFETAVAKNALGETVESGIVKGAERFTGAGKVKTAGQTVANKLAAATLTAQLALAPVAEKAAAAGAQTSISQVVGKAGGKGATKLAESTFTPSKAATGYMAEKAAQQAAKTGVEVATGQAAKGTLDTVAGKIGAQTLAQQLQFDQQKKVDNATTKPTVTEKKVTAEATKPSRMEVPTRATYTSSAPGKPPATYEPPARPTPKPKPKKSRGLDFGGSSDVNYAGKDVEIRKEF